MPGSGSPGPIRQSLAGRLARRALALAVSGWSIPLWFVLVMLAWNAAPGNPREGWSQARIWTGATGPSPSGDRAYQIRDIRYALFQSPDGSMSLERRSDQDSGLAIVEAMIRRTRIGLFVPWHEKTDMRVLAYTGPSRDWHTGTSNPDWPRIIEAFRTRQDARANEREIRLTTHLERELAGELPDHRIIVGALLLDIGSVVAHLLLASAALLFVRHLFLADRRESRIRAGSCSSCGYDRKGLSTPCPECGQAEP